MHTNNFLTFRVPESILNSAIITDYPHHVNPPKMLAQLTQLDFYIPFHFINSRVESCLVLSLSTPIRPLLKYC